MLRYDFGAQEVFSPRLREELLGSGNRCEALHGVKKRSKESSFLDVLRSFLRLVLGSSKAKIFDERIS